MQSGVILFDAFSNSALGEESFSTVTSGWASLGGEPAVRVASVDALVENTLWVTNLSEEQLYRTGLSANPSLRCDTYLRASLRQLAMEIGADPSVVGVEKFSEVMATIATDRLKVRLTTASLCDDIAAALSVPTSQLDAKVYGIFESSALRTYVRPTSAKVDALSGQMLVLRPNRLSHARRLLKHPLPVDSSWEHVTRRSLPAGDRDVDVMLSRLTTPFMARCELLDLDEQSRALLNFPTIGGDGTAWLTDVEWRCVQGLGSPKCMSVLICSESAKPLPQASSLDSGPLATLSFTSGLIAELVWSALSLKRPARGFRYTAAATWLRALDRMTMFSYAKALASDGLAVCGYGSGNVAVACPPGHLRGVLRSAINAGLLPPANKLVEVNRQYHPFEHALA
jgi:hypothetical protein